MSIVSFPSEIWSIIIGFSGSIALANLLQVGVPSLPPKLLQLTRFDVTWNGFSPLRWPSILRKWPRLHELRIHNESVIYNFICLLPNLPRSSEILTCLDLNFANSLLALVKPSPPHEFRDLNTLYPNLHTLKLRGRSHFRSTLLAVLPKKLVYLGLDFHGEVKLVDFVRSLPDTLEEVFMRVSTPYRPEDLGERDKLTWPPRLRRLLIQSSLVGSAPFETLPETLEFFDAMVLGGIQRFPSHKLPRGITEMDFRTGSHAMLDFASLPLTLRKMTVSATRPHSTSDPEDHMDLASLPPNLTYFYVSMEAEMNADSNLSHLPHTLTSLTLPKIPRVWFITAHLPRGLKHFSVPDLYSPSMLQDLPPGLTHLATIRLEEASHAKFLPPRLEYLRTAGSLDGELLTLLPPTLTSLNCELSRNTSMQHINALPPTIKSLDLKLYGSTWDSYKLIKSDWTFPPAPTLKTLSLSFSQVVPPGFGYWLSDVLPGMSQIRNLDISDGDLREALSTEPFPLDFMLHLPPSLTSFRCFATKQLEDMHLAQLPPKLRNLTISGVLPKLTNDFARQLPRGLTKLDLGLATGLTNDCVPHLPPHLLTLSMSPMPSAFQAPLFSSVHKTKDFDLEVSRFGPAPESD